MFARSVAGILLAGLSTQALAEVRETREVKNYQFAGASMAEARASMNKVRPRGYDAFTTWQINWRYTYKQANGRCSIATVTVNLAIVYTMPDLQTSDAALDRSFKGYLVKLRAHEDGHAENGRIVARRVDDAIPKLSAATCEELGKNANALGQSIVKEGNALDIEYDKQTDHGRTQGARWQ